MFMEYINCQEVVSSVMCFVDMPNVGNMEDAWRKEIFYNKMFTSLNVF